MTEIPSLTTKQQETRNAAMNFYNSFRHQLMPPVAAEILPVEPPPEAEVVTPRVEEVAPIIPVRPPQPDTVRTRHTETSLDRRLDESLAQLLPETLTIDSAQIVFNLVGSVKPVHCTLAGLTQEQLTSLWQPKIEAWWNALGGPARDKFVAAAQRVTGGSAEDDMNRRLTAARMIGYRRLLDGIFSREPARLYETYTAVKNGQTPFCPEGFSAGACEEWREFLKTEWFSTISPEERIRVDLIVERSKTNPGLIARKERELAEKKQQLKKIDSIGGKITRFFSSEKRPEHGTEARKALVHDIEQLNLELQELRVSDFIDAEIAHADAQQHSTGDRAGLGARILSSARQLFAWIFSKEKTHTPQSLRGKVFGALSGVYYNVPSVVERWMVEAGCTRAAGTLAEQGGRSSNHNESARELYDTHRIVNNEGRPEIDWSAYLFALQLRITVEIERIAKKSQPLKIAVEREPLKGLLKAYYDAVPHVAPAMRNQHEVLTTIITQQLAEAEHDLRNRAGARAERINHLVSGNDVNWIESLMDAQQVIDPNSPARPSATPEHGADRDQLGLRYSFIVGAQQTTVGAVRQIVHTFDPTKSQTALNRDTQQFLTTGWVFESGDTVRKHLIAHNGVQTLALYPGDRLTAVQDAAAPFGLHIEVIRKAPPQHEGYSVKDLTGKHDLYYQHVPNGTVHVWKIDEHGSKQFIGHFEGNKLIEYQQKSWKYIGADGKQRQVGEFEENIFFKPDGTVVTKHQHRFADLGKLPASFEKAVNIIKKDGSHESLKLDAVGHTYFITPKNEVVEYHASVNEMRVMGRLS